MFWAALVAVLAQVPLWEPVWQLNRSTAANVCNRSDYIDLLPGEYQQSPIHCIFLSFQPPSTSPFLTSHAYAGGGDLGEFGLITFDWSNNCAAWSGANGKSKEGNMCEQDLVC